jgi:hypothetical protein
MLIFLLYQINSQYIPASAGMDRSGLNFPTGVDKILFPFYLPSHEIDDLRFPVKLPTPGGKASRDDEPLNLLLN